MYKTHAWDQLKGHVSTIFFYWNTYIHMYVLYILYVAIWFTLAGPAIAQDAPLYDAAQDIAYMEMVVQETLRMYPIGVLWACVLLLWCVCIRMWALCVTGFTCSQTMQLTVAMPAISGLAVYALKTVLWVTFFWRKEYKFWSKFFRYTTILSCGVIQKSLTLTGMHGVEMCVLMPVTYTLDYCKLHTLEWLCKCGVYVTQMAGLCSTVAMFHGTPSCQIALLRLSLTQEYSG